MRLLVVFLVFAAVAAAVTIGRLPASVFWIYLAFSLIAFVLYAWDKSAARNNRRRTRERTLHLIALLGGWPGALLAQQVLRHKSVKREFQVLFWITVVVNGGVLIWLLSEFADSRM